MDIIRRAIKLCDHLVIGIAINSDKGPAFSLKERTEMVREETAQFSGDGHATIEVKPFENLTIQFAAEVGAAGSSSGLACGVGFRVRISATWA